MWTSSFANALSALAHARCRDGFPLQALPRVRHASRCSGAAGVPIPWIARHTYTHAAVYGPWRKKKEMHWHHDTHTADTRASGQSEQRMRIFLSMSRKSTA